MCPVQVEATPYSIYGVVQPPFLSGSDTDMFVGGVAQSCTFVYVHQAEGSRHFFLDLQRLSDDGLGKHSFLLCSWRPNNAASLGHQVNIRKHLSQINRQDIDKPSKFLLNLPLYDGQQVLIIALPPEKLKDLQSSLLQFLGQPHLFLFFCAVMGISGDDGNELVLQLVLWLAKGEASEVLKLLDALLNPHCVKFYDFVEVGDRQHCPFITNFYFNQPRENKIYFSKGEGDVKQIGLENNKEGEVMLSDCLQYDTQQSSTHIIDKMSKSLLSILFILPLISTYMQFQLQRNPHKTKKLALLKSECQDPSKLTQQAKYLQLCYEKDIAYVFQFKHRQRVFYLALDLTSPISWIKDQKCKLLDTNKACTFVRQNFNEKIKGLVKQKVNDLMSKLKNKIADDDSKAIIEGSNQIIMGDVTQIKDLSIVAKNHDHLSKALDVVLLGLYIIGQNDNITLKSTNFIAAHSITPNLNSICDGAVSLRFDDSSEKSFLCELFDLTANKDNIISVYLGKDKSFVTIGAMSQRFAEKGLSSIVKVKLEEDDKYGKLPRMQGIVFESQDEINNIQADSLIIFTLSSSYIAFPSQIITPMFSKFFPSTLKCKINSDSYVQCLNSNKQDISTLMQTSLDIDLDTSMIHFLLKQLVLTNEKGRLIFNIKQTVNNYTVIGQPFFLNYYVYFDYGKNQLGYAARKLTIQQHIVSAITMIHFIIITLLLGFCYLFTSDPCKKIYFRIFMKMVDRTQDTIKSTVRRYQPVNENEEKVARTQEVQGI